MWKRSSYIKPRYFTFFVDIALSLLAPLIIVVYLLKDILFPLNGYIFYGDASLVIRLDIHSFIRYFLFTWDTMLNGLGSSAGYLFIFPYFIYTILSELLGYQLMQRVQILLLACLPSTSMYFAVKILSRRWFSEVIRGSATRLHLLSFMAGILYGFNYANSNITDPIGAAGLQYAYIFLPITFAFFVEYLYTGSLRYLLGLGVFSMFAAISPMWAVFFSFLALSYLAFALAFERGRRWGLFRRALLSIAFLVALNMFWIVPTAAGYILGATGPFAEYQPEKRLQFVSYEGMMAMYRLLDAIMFGHKEYYLFGLWPQNWNLANIAIPVSAFLAMLLVRNKHTYYLSIIAIISTFMLKGTSPPFGELYIWIVLHLPYGLGAVLVNYGTWAYVQAFSYFLLISLTLLTFISKGSRDKIYLLVSIALMVPIFYAVINGLYIDSQVYLPRFKPQDIPRVYYEVNNWLEQQPQYIKVTWIPSSGPSSGVPFWKGYVVTAFPDTISQRTSVYGWLVQQIITSKNISLGDLATLMGVKYVIYHNDILGFDREKLYEALARDKSFRRVAIFTEEYKVKDNYSSPYSSMSSIREYNGVSVMLIEPKNLTIERGREYTLKIRYHIPQDILQKLDFHNVSSSRIWAFEAGSELDLSKMIYHHIGPKSIIAFNDTDGILEFPLKVDEMYNGNGIDIYIDFYGPSFSKVTPLLFLGRFKVEPEYVMIYIEVFENINYKGPIFIASGGAANIISYEQVSPVEWRVTVNASQPFLLVFTERYDKLWRAYTNRAELKPIPIYDLVNGFEINSTGVINITIYYTLQTYLYIGLALSFMTLIALTVALVHSRIRGISRRAPS